MFLDAMDLYKTLDLKFNTMDSSHFENNFKRTINCPQLGLIWMSLVSGWLTGVTVAILKWKSGGTAGQRKKVGGPT